jgi:DNA-binding transcriptional MerR regulator
VTALTRQGRPDATLTIGDVLAQLKPEFADLTISKIRFLEDQGLVHPDRTPSGYRKYAPVDIARLRYVLAQQKDHFLPLKVIKEQLEKIDRGLVPAHAAEGAQPRVPHVTVAAIQDNAPTAAQLRPAAAELRLSREELLNAAGLREDQLRELEQFRLVNRKASGHYDDDALVIAKIAAELAVFGLEGRHLKAFRTAAEREVGLFGQIAGPMARQKGQDAKAKAEQAVLEMAALSVRLHAALVLNGLREIIA